MSLGWGQGIEKERDKVCMGTTHGNGEWWNGNGNGNGRESKIKPVRVRPMLKGLFLQPTS